MPNETIKDILSASFYFSTIFPTMNKKQLFIFMLLSVLMTNCTQQRNRVIELPEAGLRSHQVVEISKVVLTDTATILHIDANFHPNWWIRIDSTTYIQANGRQYVVERAEGINLNEHHFMPDSGEDHFVLFFPPIPRNTRTIDFIGPEDSFRIWDINLTGRDRRFRPDLPADVLNFRADATVSLPEPVFEIGNTSVTLHITGLRDGFALNDFRMFINNVFTQMQEEIEPQEVERGVFLFEFDLFATTPVFIGFYGNFGLRGVSMILSPGESAEMFVDATAHSKSISRLRPRPDLVYAGFRGKFAQVNTKLLQTGGETEGRFTHIGIRNHPEIIDMSAQEYIDFLRTIYNDKVTQLENSDLPIAVRQVFMASLKADFVNNIWLMQHNIEDAYRALHNLAWNAPIDFVAPTPTESELISALQDLDIGNPMNMYGRFYGFGIVLPATWRLSLEALNEITGSETGFLQDMHQHSITFHQLLNTAEVSEERRNALQTAFLPKCIIILLKNSRDEWKKQWHEAVLKLQKRRMCTAIEFLKPFLQNIMESLCLSTFGQLGALPAFKQKE